MAALDPCPLKLVLVYYCILRTTSSKRESPVLGGRFSLTNSPRTKTLFRYALLPSQPSPITQSSADHSPSVPLLRRDFSLADAKVHHSRLLPLCDKPDHIVCQPRDRPFLQQDHPLSTSPGQTKHHADRRSQGNNQYPRLKTNCLAF